MNILLAGGGTAGHTNPALAIAEAFMTKHRDVNIAFVGREGGRENSLVEKADIKLYTIPISGLSRNLSLENVRNIKKALCARTEALKIIEEFKPDAVIGTGGYVCWPVLSAAIKAKIPTALHESNAVLGLSSKLLARKCNLLLLGAKPDGLKYKNAHFTGNPLRKSFVSINKKQARRLLRIPDSKIFIVSVGGSIGAKKLNDVCISVMKSFSMQHSNIIHLHSCGHRYFEEIRKSEKRLCEKTDGCRIVPFIDNMACVLSAADIVISRCGAMTLSEIAFCGTPAILVPSPNVTGNHQFINAEYFCRSNAALMIEESNLTETHLTGHIKKLINNPPFVEKMKKNMYSLAVRNAGDKIVELLERKMLT